MPDSSEKRIRKRFPGVKERREVGREGEQGKRLLSRSYSGDSITQRKVVDRSCRRETCGRKAEWE